MSSFEKRVKEWRVFRGKAISYFETRHNTSAESCQGVLVPQITTDWKEQTHSSCFGNIHFTAAGCSFPVSCDDGFEIHKFST